MNRSLVIALAALVVAALTLSLGSTPSARACPSTNDADLRGPISVDWDQNSVEFELEASWATVGTPFIGVMEEAETFGVDDIQYDPLYFFPSSCESGSDPLTIEVTATKVASEVGYALNTRLQVGPVPNYAQAYWVVSIHE